MLSVRTNQPSGRDVTDSTDTETAADIEELRRQSFTEVAGLRFKLRKKS